MNKNYYDEIHTISTVHFKLSLFILYDTVGWKFTVEFLNISIQVYWQIFVQIHNLIYEYCIYIPYICK